MSRESLVRSDRRILFSESFTPQSITRNGGSLFGSGSLSTTGTLAVTHQVKGGISYAHNPITDNSFTLRIKAIIPSFLTSVGGYYHLMRHHQQALAYGFVTIFGGTGSNYIRFMLGNGDRFTYTTPTVTSYMDDKCHDIVCVYDSDVLGNSKIYIDGVDLTDNVMSGGSFYSELFRIGCNTSDNNTLGTTFELVEIYDGALSPEEVSLLYSNKVYRGYGKEGLVLDCDYTQGTGRNLADPSMSYTGNNATYLHGLGYNGDGSSSYINYGNIPLLGSDDFTIEIVTHVGISPAGYFVSRRGVGNKWFYVGYSDPTQFYALFANDWASAEYTSVSKIIPSGTKGKVNHIIVKRDSDTFYIYLNGEHLYGPRATTAGWSFDSASNGLWVGAWTGGSYLDNASTILSTRIYKGRALTAEEIRQNYQYAVDREWVNG